MCAAGKNSAGPEVSVQRLAGGVLVPAKKSEQPLLQSILSRYAKHDYKRSHVPFLVQRYTPLEEKEQVKRPWGVCLL